MENIVREILEQKWQENEFRRCYLVDVEWKKTQKKLTVYVDCDDSFTLKKSRALHLWLRERLEEEHFPEGNFLLEISSPGLERPLKLKRQYEKNIGRHLKVSMVDGASIEGELREIDEDQIIVVEQKGKGKKGERLERKIGFDNIGKAIVIPSLKK